MGTNAISTMNVSALAVFSLSLATTLFGEDSNGPVITVRKGTSQQVEIKEIGGPAGGAATSVLKNDIQLSGALSLGDTATATITVSGTASPASFNGLATEKSGGVVLQKSYSGETRHAVHQFTNDLIETVTGQKGIALSKVAFVADRTGHKEIYTCDYDGARTLQLTHDGAISVSPAIVRRWPAAGLYGLSKRLCRYLPGRSDQRSAQSHHQIPWNQLRRRNFTGRNAASHAR